GYKTAPWCDLCEVPLSIVYTRTTETARLVVQCLTGEYEPGRVLTVEPRLVKRVSSGASHAESGRMRSDEGVVAAIMEPCEGR
ncbi:MAG: hypothetical protein L6437_13250, partial [Kiritimatiellae bacterium]|nr:hypothetical protein [Kiritimatiellia bacterium]